MNMPRSPGASILLVDDEPDALESLAIALDISGFNNVVRLNDPRQVLPALQKRPADLVLMDYMMPFVTGEELLENMLLEHPDTPVIMVTGVDELETAVSCMRKGAQDYITKPVDRDRLITSVDRALEMRDLKRENSSLARNLLSDGPQSPQLFQDILTTDKAMLSIFKYCEAVAAGREPILITGETGVGKELFAKALHAASGVKGPFVAVNVAGLDDHVFSDTLFGHIKGAYTGADRRRDGLIVKAAGGTLFLDEIGDLSETSQTKLLRILQEREYYPLGSDSPRPTDARIVVATLKDLDTLRSEGTFRQDLYYRLSTHKIRIPPLRERKADVPLLLRHFLHTAAEEFNKPPPTIPDELPTLLKNYDYPGNVRELRAMVYDAVGRHTSKKLSMQTFKDHLFGPGGSERPNAPAGDDCAAIFTAVETLPTLKQGAAALVAEAMRRTGGNQRLAAAILGISHQALNKRLKK